jgi:hypothetical protein
MRVNCPFCSVVLPARELADGWCESCGKKLPLSLVPKRTGERGRSLSLDRSRPRGRLRIAWVSLLGAVFFGLVGLALIPVALGADYRERMYRRTLTGAIFKKSATEQRCEHLVGALGILGLAVFLGTRSVTRKPDATEQRMYPPGDSWASPITAGRP